jgi:hypothetical protein
MGGAGHKMAHNVFVWDRESGTLVKVMEGPKESLIDCDVSGCGCGVDVVVSFRLAWAAKYLRYPRWGKGEAPSAGDT